VAVAPAEWLQELSSLQVLSHTLDLYQARGMRVLGRFVIESAAARFKGGQGVVQFVRDTHTGEECAIKFFTHRGAFERERQLYEADDAALRAMMAAVKVLERNEDKLLLMAAGHPFPPCIVVEVRIVATVCPVATRRALVATRRRVQKGESLDTWATHVRPSFIAVWQVLADLMQLLAAMHAAGVVHRDLKPANVLWRPHVHEWTLIDFGCAARVGALLGSVCVLCCVVECAAPGRAAHACRAAAPRIPQHLRLAGEQAMLSLVCLWTLIDVGCV
jgi:serine/threonine protein kinase